MTTLAGFALSRKSCNSRLADLFVQILDLGLIRLDLTLRDTQTGIRNVVDALPRSVGDHVGMPRADWPTR